MRRPRRHPRRADNDHLGAIRRRLLDDGACCVTRSYELSRDLHSIALCGRLGPLQKNARRPLGVLHVRVDRKQRRNLENAQHRNEGVVVRREPTRDVKCIETLGTVVERYE